MPIVYVRLLKEGTEVFRPCEAEALGENVFELLHPAYHDPDDECWEFEPGSHVRAEPRKFATGEYLVAVSRAPRESRGDATRTGV